MKKFDSRVTSTNIQTLLWFVAISLITFVSSIVAETKPNIVFILADDMNRDTWGAYGGKDCRTPNIDQLSKDGIRFDRAYCTVAMCAPFRQELYSGRTPWRTGTLPNHSKSNPQTKSIPHYLKPLGYRVALVGKSHVGPRTAYPFEYLKVNKGAKLNTKLVESSNRFIDSCLRESKPFCLFVASNDSHAPFTTGDPSVYDADKLTIPPYWLDTPELRKTLVKYYAEISNFDALVGKMRESLEKRGVWKNTLFIVCSEQGTQLPFAKWTCYDNGLHTGLIASWPRIIKPGSVVQELISTADITPTLVEAVGGKLRSEDVDGISFLKTLHGKRQVLHQYVFGAFTNCNIIDNRQRIYPIRVIRSKQFSLIYNPNHKQITSNVTLTGVLERLKNPKNNLPSSKHPATSFMDLKGTSNRANQLIEKLNRRPEFEFYDLKADPFELKNEIENPQFKSTIEKMKKDLMSRLVALGDSDPIATEKSLVKKKGNRKKK